MTNAMGAGEQDRNNNTSETRPYIPPPKTKNCYLNDPIKGFNRANCGTSGDNACKSGDQDYGGISGCIPDDYGGYCQDKYKQIFIASGNTFIHLRADQVIDRYKSNSNTGEVNREVNRALSEQKKKYNNKIRELQIMGKLPITNNNYNNKENDNNEVHSFVSDLLVKIGIGFSFIMFLISLSVLMIQNKII